MLNLAAASYVLAALAYGAFAILVGAKLLRGDKATSATLSLRLLAALLASLLWAVLGLLAPRAGLHSLEAIALPLADSLRYALWFEIGRAHV